MTSLRNFIAAYLNNDKGATAIEYAVMAAGIALAITAAVSLLGGAVLAKFTFIQANIP